MLNIGGPDCKNISFENTYVAGISFAKLDDPISDFKHKLDAAAGVICRRTLSEYIEDVRVMEKRTIMREIAEDSPDGFGIIADGTTNICEMGSLTIRWFNKASGQFKQRLLLCLCS